MTHDELLARVSDYKNAAFGFLVALRAVVAMHAPEYGDFPDVEPVCGWCTCRDCGHIVDYPCKTIRKIEAELL